jgi:NAD(P)H-quinone oxidoreductase subunit 5
MQSEFLSSIILLSPLAFILTALVSWFQPGLRPLLVKKFAVASTLISMLTAAISGFFMTKYDLLESTLIGVNQLGFSLRLDVVSVLMYSMIAIIGFIVVKFSLNYMDGDARQGRFIGRLAATIASVQLLVLSGNLALLLLSWILTSICLHRLLVFYTDRPGAIIAAKKKFIVARLGDICLLGAVVLLYFQFGTGNLEVIFQEIKSSISLGSVNGSLEAVGLLLAFAALLKSAQFPTHGWLIEVMETPTPVSALLHAGILNAGPFLLIRMAYVMEASTYAPLLIIAIGGFTAIFASVAFLTQTSIKTALGYSSVAHMGFSLMVCGLGAYPVAMLHLVAHSFYKAHSFLSSGSIIDLKRASKVKKANRTGSPFKIAFGIVLALLVYIGFSILWGIDLQKDVALLAIGSIIVMGLATIFTAALDSDGSFKLMLRASILAIIVAAAFFTLESGMHLILSSQLPEIVGLSFIETILMSILLLAFSVVVFIQMLAPVLSATPMYRNLAIHFRNGLYANAIFDRIVGALHIQRPENSSSESEEIERLQQFENFEIKRLEEQMA